MAYESWSYKRKVKLDTTSSGANVSGNVSNFAVLVPLDSSNFNFSQADPNGADIRFADSELWGCRTQQPENQGFTSMACSTKI